MMKKTILLLVAALCGVLTAAAQDLIVKTDATKVEAKVTEITPDAVRCRLSTRRLTVFLRQVSKNSPPNRTYTSRRIRLSTNFFSV